VVDIYTIHKKQDGQTSASSAGFEATLYQQTNSRIPMPAAATLEPEPTQHKSAPIYKKSDKTDCINYRGISVLPATYKILSNILLSRLTPYAEEIIGYNQCGFRRNLSATDHIFCIHKILEKKWEYNERVHQL